MESPILAGNAVSIRTADSIFPIMVDTPMPTIIAVTPPPTSIDSGLVFHWYIKLTIAISEIVRAMKKEMLADKWGLILTTVVRKSPLIALITTDEMIIVAMLQAIWICRYFIPIYGPTRPTRYKQSQVAPTSTRAFMLRWISFS